MYSEIRFASNNWSLLIKHSLFEKLISILVIKVNTEYIILLNSWTIYVADKELGDVD